MRPALVVSTTLALLALMAVPAASFGKSARWQAFHTPSGHIVCDYFHPRLRCDIEGPTYRQPKKNCHGIGDFGFSFALLTTGGRGHGICVSDAVAPSGHVLHYGTRWSRGGITCVSRTTGLTCRKGRHFMFLSRQKYKVG
jgi:hypothetical protein